MRGMVDGHRGLIATTACGKPLSPRERWEVERLAERLGLVPRQVETIEAEHDAALHCTKAERRVAAAGSGARTDTSIAALAWLEGIGANCVTLLTHEVFYRQFRSRPRARELGRADADSVVGQQRRPARPGDRPRRARLDLRPAPADDVALVRHQPISALSQ